MLDINNIRDRFQKTLKELTTEVEQLQKNTLPEYQQERLLNGFTKILRRIASNSEQNLQLTHKEVRAYARSMLVTIDNIDNLVSEKDEISILLFALSQSGLAHYDRAFLANQIIELINKIIQEKVERQNKTYDNIEDCF